MRILWSSLGDWFRPDVEGIEVVPVDHTTSARDLIEAIGSAPYWFFFEPTPHPGWPYDPLRLATRLAAVAPVRPARVVAFVSKPSPTPWETQCAFAAQVGRILGVIPQIQRVETITRTGPAVLQAKDAKDPDDPGPSVDWGRALADAASPNPESVEPLDQQIQKFASYYLDRRRGSKRFGPAQRELLHEAAKGTVSVAAEDLAKALYRQRETMQRAIAGIAEAFPDPGPDLDMLPGGERRTGPAAVARLVYRYGWFLQVNPP